LTRTDNESSLDSQIPLEVVLKENPQMKESFRSFLLGEWSAENLFFWDDVQKLKAMNVNIFLSFYFLLKYSCFFLSKISRILCELMLNAEE
jgi:hypothetical protein